MQAQRTRSCKLGIDSPNQNLEASIHRMGNRLTQIATRTGDDGTTGLGDNTRVPKYSLRVQAMGDVDELNSNIGVLLCEPMPEAVREELLRRVTPDSVARKRDDLRALIESRVAELDA